jgi:hypothetical protein
MTYGSSVRDDTQQLREVQDLIARLNDVNRKLALPIRAISITPAEASAVEVPASA